MPKPLPKPEVVALVRPNRTPIFEETAVALPVPPAPKPPVKTDVFADGNTLKPTTALPPRQVQTGGFGDPNGARGEGRPDRSANIASLGSFDLRVGSGAGNGTAGARGTRGVVDAGFGESAGSQTPNRANVREAVTSGGFADARQTAVQPVQRVQAAVRETPVEILFKPRPDYTNEARNRKVEGEVLVRVLFTAGGEVRVLETLRTLGHGLDDNALKAARQIRFKPATRSGVPVDSTAVVHIVFELAY
jgi:TonB family protein